MQLSQKTEYAIHSLLYSTYQQEVTLEEEEQVLNCLAEARNCDAVLDCKILHVFNDAYQKMLAESEL